MSAHFAVKTHLNKVIRMWSPHKDGWVLVGVPDCNGKSVAKNVQLCVEV